MNKQIEEMAKYCCYACEFENNGECDLAHPIGECTLATATAMEIYKAGYRKKDEVAREIFADIEQAIFAHGTKYAMKRLEELKKKYEVTDE